MSVDRSGELTGTLSRLFDAVGTPVLVVGSDGRLVHLNRAAEVAMGARPDALRGLPADALFAANSPASFLAEAKTPDGALRSVTTPAGERVIRWSARELALDSASLLVCTGVDVTEQEREAAARRHFDRQVQALFANVPALLFALDRAGTITLAAGRGLTLFGEESSGIVGTNVFERFSNRPEVAEGLTRALAGESVSGLVELRGYAFEVQVEPIRGENGEIAGVVGVAADVTERRRQDQLLAQAQKMESLGVLAGSVAHDFNNLLTAILGFAGLLKLSPSLDPRDREQLLHIEQAARRGADIAGRLLSFSRGGLARFVPVDLRDVVQETARLVSPTLSNHIRMVLDLPARSVMVEGDDGQLQQALLNIMLNARDALHDHGTIEVHLGVRDGNAVVSITDDGPGIDPETRARIFEPFFTTKERGAGTGLGLAITYGIVRGHKGRIDIDSEPGKGTTFTLTFPLVPADRLPSTESDAGEGNLILVVDDDELVRRSTSATLSSLGYSVVEVGDGNLAIDLVRARPGRFAAVLLDLVMPGLTGLEVFHAIAEIRPDLPVLVATGYAADDHIDDSMKRSIAGLLQKPFSAEQLAVALQRVGARPGRRVAAHVT